MGARNPFFLITAFQKFLEKFPEAKENSQLFFIGEQSNYISQFSEFKKIIPQLYSSDGYVPYSTVLALQQFTSVNLILEAKSSISPFLPGKFPHCIMAGKPIFLLGPYYSECKRLLGIDYPYWSEIDDVDKISDIISSLYLQWRENPAVLRLKRPDLEHYLSAKHLKETIERLLTIYTRRELD